MGRRHPPRTPPPRGLRPLATPPHPRILDLPLGLGDVTHFEILQCSEYFANGKAMLFKLGTQTEPGQILPVEHNPPVSGAA